MNALTKFATRIALAACAITLSASLAAAQAGNGEKGTVNFLQPINPDPVLQHSKEIYVLMGCAYCHGVDLKVRNGEAADLLHSAIVASDVNGNVLAPLLRAGIPQTAKLSPMPQFSDLSDQEIGDIVRWIHYARQDGKFKELTAAESAAGDAAAGKSYFDKSCASCHASKSDVVATAAKSSAGLRSEMLRPTVLQGVESWSVNQLDNKKLGDARAQHQHLLENYSATDVANLLAFLSR